MNEPIIKLTNILTGESGTFLIHLFLFLPILLAAQLVWLNRKVLTPSVGKKFFVGFGGLILIQSISVFIAILYLPVLVQAQLFPAILERTTAIASLLILIWLWFSDKTKRFIDPFFGLLLLVSFIYFLYTLFSQNQTTIGTNFNAGWYDIGWQVFSSLAALTGILLLIFLKPKNWGLMLIFVGAHLAAFMLHVTLNDGSGNYSFLVRLAQVFTYPLIPLMFQTILPAKVEVKSVSLDVPALPIVEEPDLPIVESKSSSKVDYPVLHTWTSILEEEKPDKILISVCRALATTLKADLCYIISSEISQKDLLLQGGFDLIREVEKTGGSIKKNKLPLITRALENSETLQLTLDGDKAGDISALTNLLNLETDANILILPMGSYSTVKSAVLLLSPYSKRTWSEEEQHQIEPINRSINKLFENISHRTQLTLDNEHFAEQVTQLEIANQEWQEQNKTKEDQLEAEKLENERLHHEIEAHLARMHNMVEKSQYDGIVSRHQQNQSVIEQLNNNNEELKMQLDELKTALFEIDSLQPVNGVAKFDGSTELESMLAIQLESQEVISRLYRENQSMQSELEQLSTNTSAAKGKGLIQDKTTIASLFESKKSAWFEQIALAKMQENQQKISALNEQLEDLAEQISELKISHENKEANKQISELQQLARQLKNGLMEITLDEKQITFPQLLDDIFESLNPYVILQDLTLRVDIPEGMNDLPIHDHKISHLMKTLLQDLVQSLHQDEWLSIKIEKQNKNLIIHISMGCSAELQSIILDMLSATMITAQDLDTHFGLILTKNLVETMQGMIESTQNTLEQTNLFIRLPMD